jgi:hypothetical protein
MQKLRAGFTKGIGMCRMQITREHMLSWALTPRSCSSVAGNFCISNGNSVRRVVSTFSAPAETVKSVSAETELPPKALK